MNIIIKRLRVDETFDDRIRVGRSNNKQRRKRRRWWWWWRRKPVVHFPFRYLVFAMKTPLYTISEEDYVTLYGILVNELSPSGDRFALVIYDAEIWSYSSEITLYSFKFVICSDTLPLARAAKKMPKPCK